MAEVVEDPGEKQFRKQTPCFARLSIFGEVFLA
jgi:hypothetical protein